MELTLPLREAVAVLTATGVLPPWLTDVRGDTRAVLARARVADIPGVPGAVRGIARLAPPADVRIDDRGVAGRTWTLTLDVSHPLLPGGTAGLVTDAVNAQLAKAPHGLATARTEGGRTLVEVDLDALAALLPLPAATGLRVTVTHVELGDEVRLVASLTAPGR